jgi:hypothetical protein
MKIVGIYIAFAICVILAIFDRDNGNLAVIYSRFAAMAATAVVIILYQLKRHKNN